MNLRLVDGVQTSKIADHSCVGWGYTYFVRHRDAIKIGFSGAPKKRIKQIQISFPDPLDVLAIVPNTIIDEPTAHKKFAHLRMSGEWFRAAPELLDFISRVKAEADRLPQREYPSPEVEVQRRALMRARHHLARLRPSYPAAEAYISLLISQISNYQDNRDGLRPGIRKSIEQIEAAL